METLFGNDKMTFGKYYGIEVKILIQSNPKYLLWLDGKRVILSNFVRRECEIRAYPRVWTGKRWINRLPIEQITNLNKQI